METRQEIDVIALSEKSTGFARRLLITHEEMSYHATLFWHAGDGYDLIFRDIPYPEWAKDYDLGELENQTWGGCVNG